MLEMFNLNPFDDPVLLVILLGLFFIPRKNKDSKVDEFGRDDNPQIDKIKQNYVNGVIDEEIFEKAVDDVLNGRSNSYAEAVYDVETNPSRKKGGLPPPPIKPTSKNYRPASASPPLPELVPEDSMWYYDGETFQIDQVAGEIVEHKRSPKEIQWAKLKKRAEEKKLDLPLSDTEAELDNDKRPKPRVKYNNKRKRY